MKRETRKGERIALVLVTLALLTAPASASTFVSMDHAELVTMSDAVVQGRVIGVESFWDPTGSVIMSEAVIEVSDAVVGSVARQIRVQTFGGQVDDYHVVAHGFPNFQKGQEVLLFINDRESGDSSLRVTGYQLGHYRVVEREGIKIAEPTLEEGVQLFDRFHKLAEPPKAMQLHELKSRIRTFANVPGQSQ